MSGLCGSWLRASQAGCAGSENPSGLVGEVLIDRVSENHKRRHLARDLQRFGERNRSMLKALGQSQPFYVLHDQVVRSDVVERADVRVIEGSGGSRFPPEALREPLGRNFDCELRVLGACRGPCTLRPSTGANGLQDLVWAEFCPAIQAHDKALQAIPVAWARVSMMMRLYCGQRRPEIQGHLFSSKLWLRSKIKRSRQTTVVHYRNLWACLNVLMDVMDDMPV
jgi:hypothetical protein